MTHLHSVTCRLPFSLSNVMIDHAPWRADPSPSSCPGGPVLVHPVLSKNQVGLETSDFLYALIRIEKPVPWCNLQQGL